MKKNGREAEDSRYQDTVLGGHVVNNTAGPAGDAVEESEVQPVQIVGGPVTSISDWVRQFQAQPVSVSDGEGDGAEEGATPASSALTSAPATPAGMDVDVEAAHTPLSVGVSQEQPV
jgi:hypothetical protein